jgi:hypothetical protein
MRRGRKRGTGSAAAAPQSSGHLSRQDPLPPASLKPNHAPPPVTNLTGSWQRLLESLLLSRRLLS